MSFVETNRWHASDLTSSEVQKATKLLSAQPHIVIQSYPVTVICPVQSFHSEREKKPLKGHKLYPIELKEQNVFWGEGWGIAFTFQVCQLMYFLRAKKKKIETHRPRFSTLRIRLCVYIMPCHLEFCPLGTSCFSKSQECKINKEPIRSTQFVTAVQAWCATLIGRVGDRHRACAREEK